MRLPIVVNTYLPATISKLWLIIGEILDSESGEPHFNVLVGVIP